MKYVGMTTDPHRRKQEWEQKRGQSLPTFQVIRSDLTYDEAWALEDKYRKMGYKAQPGGQRMGGSVYSVYTYEYY